MVEGPLHGLLVADFSRVLAGPYATQQLGDLGAEVVKVERPGAGDDTRAWGPPFAEGRSTYYLAANRNKRSVVLDLGDPQHRRDAIELASRADVLVHNFRPGVPERFGLDHGGLSVRNPRLVHCTISAFGPEDEQGLPGYDLLVQAMGGLMSITGAADGEPTKVGVALVDVLTGMNAVIGVLAALRERDRTGRGQRVEVDLLSSVLAATVNQASGYLNAGVVPHRMGNRHPSVAPYETFHTADEPLAVAVGNDTQFASLCAVLGLERLAVDPRFETNELRVGNRDALGEILERTFVHRGRDEWLAALRAVGVPCGPVNDLAQAIALAGEVAAQPVIEQRREDGTLVRGLASPVRLSATPATYRLPPPELDQHGGQLRAWLRSSPSASPPTG
jgi:crotonobetainyl-CoA:carnitine CoA-transferase CaiB-like acyl-CoA transferase